MYISNNYNFTPRFNYTSRKCNNNLNFTGININAQSELFSHCFETGIRIALNRSSDLFENKRTKLLTKMFAKMEPKSNEKYLQALDDVSRFFSTENIIDGNFENRILEKIAKDNNANIFIMNHSSQRKDPSMLAALYALLVSEYKNVGKTNNYPIPKIIINKDILTTMNPVRRAAFMSFGAVGVDANIFNADKKFNTKVILPLIRDFIKNKCNIFIFPEGKLAVRKDLDFDERFQIGIAELINKVLGIKKEVNVVPVGFSYGKRINGMHIGEPIKFKRMGEETTSTSGNVLKSEFAFDGFKKFFEKHKNETDVVITENGTPVKPSDTPAFIKGILAENLNICSKEAQKRIKKPLNINEVLTV